MLLQILEDGYLTDSKGRRVDFTNTIIIMTSNIGAEKLQKETNFGFRKAKTDDSNNLDAQHEINKEKVLDELKRSMRPELLNRLDRVIVFRSLSKKDIFKIIDLQTDLLCTRLQKHKLGIVLTAGAKQYLLDRGYDAHNGVRPLRRLIQDTIEDQVAMDMLDGKYSAGDIIQVSVKNSGLTYHVLSESAVNR
jgi:ATP-dependent Clp protease ATP-binding subunit ClpC